MSFNCQGWVSDLIIEVEYLMQRPVALTKYWSDTESTYIVCILWATNVQQQPHVHIGLKNSQILSHLMTSITIYTHKRKSIPVG